MARTQTTSFTFDAAIRDVQAGTISVDSAVSRLLDQLTDRELLWMLDGDVPLRSMITLPAKIKAGPIVGGAIPRLGIPGVRFADGPRGVVMGHSTAFPVTIARAATWDPQLEEQVGLAMGREARAGGANYSGAVCVNLLRHPAWGRAQECYGEDPVLTGEMGVALTAGLQRNVMACVKHFALNSMENARFRVDVTVDEHALHEVYLPHFKKVIDSGADSVMSSYNSINGKYADVNKVLLSDILRDEWGFTGFVTSDWVSGTHGGVESLDAGLDVEMPLRMIRARELPAAIKAGELAKETVLRSARRILSTTLRRAIAIDENEPRAETIAGPEHRAIARAVAIRACVLLKNDPVGETPVLPLDPSIGTLAVIGDLATDANTGDHGSSLVYPPTTSSPLDGLREALPNVRIDHVGSADIEAAREAARAADAVIVIAGRSFDDEGERVQNDDMDMSKFGFPFNTKFVQWLATKLTVSQFGRGGDREVLELDSNDELLIAAVAEANPRTAVITIGGSAIIMENWRGSVPAILHAWYPGMEGGRALADIITGTSEPGGRLPVSIPTSASHLPFFDSEARSINYDSWWGQRKLDRDGNPAAYPFGFGLGYTTFEVSLVSHHATDTEGTATVVVRNTGMRTGSTVAQVYAVDSDASRPIPQLVGFARVELDAGEETSVDIGLDLTPTRQREPGTGLWARRPGSWVLLAAQHSPSSVTGAVGLWP
jgi:beta-glucosidase